MLDYELPALNLNSEVKSTVGLLTVILCKKYKPN